MTHKPQVFLLHFAGGNRHSFLFLKAHFEPDFEFIPLELPGRGMRMKEQLLTEREAAVQEYVRQVTERRTQAPFIVYGHSMGASLALQVVAELQTTGDVPVSLVVSGKSWPITGANEQRHLMPQDAFKAGLRTLGGVPEAVLANPQLFDYFAAPLRADLEVVEKTGIDHLERLIIDSPIIALMGNEEPAAAEIGNWQRLSRKKGMTRVLPGNHFFIYEHAPTLSAIMKAAFSSAVADEKRTARF